MAFSIHISQKRPSVSSYDSGHEHSLEHLIELRQLVAEADEETDSPKLRAITTDAAGKPIAVSAKAGAA
jgi:hypothetical protein